MARPKGHPLNRDAFRFVAEQHMGSTATAIAETAGIPRATIANLFANNRGATAPVAHQIANAMGVPVGVLFPTLGASAHKYAIAEDPPASVEAA
jgi:hypothetical protein